MLLWTLTDELDELLIIIIIVVRTISGGRFDIGSGAVAWISLCARLLSENRPGPVWWGEEGPCGSLGGDVRQRESRGHQRQHSGYHAAHM